ncbi:MAG: DNA/RNA nuclease SfsA [Planctomycetes bacterium]|nr:DNA/RNA nuclease SfsA [Planctomycetota bacterium]MCL4728821.1 DNA/RNA nuclease SfsA [Planctomycetota bacterium]
MFFSYQLPVVQGTLLARNKRFLADVRLQSGSIVTALCANTGSMKTCNEPGRPVLLTDKGDGAGKYRHLWESIHMGQSWVNVNTGLPNRAVEQLVLQDAIKELAGWPYLRREVKYGRDGKSRIDLLLTGTPPPKKRKKDPDPVPRCRHDGRPDCYVEVKNTSMKAGEHSVFPDAVTERGQKHLVELTALARKGTGAAMVYFCGRTDTNAFRPADEIDPEYGRLLRKAAGAGVLILPLRVEFNETGWRPADLLPVEL